MAYKRVYSPAGEPFDIPEDRANNLILNKGWTQTPIVLTEVLEVSEDKPKTVKKTSRRKVVHEELSEEE